MPMPVSLGCGSVPNGEPEKSEGGGLHRPWLSTTTQRPQVKDGSPRQNPSGGRTMEHSSEPVENEKREDKSRILGNWERAKAGNTVGLSRFGSSAMLRE